jgi:hypothetical protein
VVAVAAVGSGSCASKTLVGALMENEEKAEFDFLLNYLVSKATPLGLHAVRAGAQRKGLEIQRKFARTTCPTVCVDM